MESFLNVKLMDHAKALFPICRSLTGDGVRETLKYFESYNPEFIRSKARTGETYYDWKVPLEWNIKDSYIEHLDSGKRYAEFKKCNLHLVGYSTPINKEIDLKDLLKRIHTQPNQPEWIPYVTSYYKDYWGFCLSEKEKKSLPPGKYKIVIDSELKEGFLDYSYAFIKGNSEKQILFSSYICHPSMANNELSGPIVINGILDYIKKQYPNPKYSYRFVLVPETIGSIIYINKNENDLKKNVICGFNLTCVGDERGYTFIQTPYNNSISDNALRAALIGKNNVKELSYLNRGSDERQYCSPGIDLPICTFSRSKFCDYPEYHTSADNLSIISEKGLKDSLEVMKSIVDSFEISLKPKCKIKCEPQLGKRNLYPNISDKNSGWSEGKHPAKLRLDLLAYCNGENNIFEIGKILNKPLNKILDELRLLKTQNIIS